MKIDEVTFVFGEPFEPEGKPGIVALPLRVPPCVHVEPWLGKIPEDTRKKIIEEARKLARSAKFQVPAEATPSYRGGLMEFPYTK